MSALHTLLHRAIAQSGGWIGFDRFMAMALYAPAMGYYSGSLPKLGMTPEGGSDFVTAPELSPWFGRTLAHSVEEALRVSGTDEIWEFGAGTGALAQQLLSTLGSRVRRYTIVDLSGDLQARQRATLQTFGDQVQWVTELPEHFAGVVVGNEVLDAMPVRLLQRRAGVWHERGVVWDAAQQVLAWPNRSSDFFAFGAKRGGASYFDKDTNTLVEGLARELDTEKQGKIVNQLGELMFTRFGNIPLFWTAVDDGVVFASLPKALFCVPGVARKLDEERLFDYLCLLPMKGDRSFFAGVQRVLPGHVMSWSEGRAQSRSFFQFDPSHTLHLPRDQDYVAALDEALRAAVARRLRSTGPVASHLSSGFDSSTVTAVAAQLLAQQGRELIAYTAAPREGYDGPVPPGRHADETVGARALAILGDSITTDHISPSTKIRPGTPAGKWLEPFKANHPPSEWGHFGVRRCNHELMVRGTFANVRLKNALVEREGNWSKHFPDGEEASIFETAERYMNEGIPTIILAGREYGTGSSRDWAAKGPHLQGVKAVIAQSFERIHRSNLIGMGILPLQYKDGQTAESLGLTGREVFEVTGIAGGASAGQDVQVRAVNEDGKAIEFTTLCRIDTPVEAEYHRHGGIMQYVLRSLLDS